MGRFAAIAVFLSGVSAVAAVVYNLLGGNGEQTAVVVFNEPFSVASFKTSGISEKESAAPVLKQTPQENVDSPVVEKTDLFEKPSVSGKKTPASVEQDVPVSLTPQICEKLLLPAALNGPDYVAGVDVDGRPVVSADYTPENGVVPADLPSNDAYGVAGTVEKRVNDMAFTVNLRLDGVYSDNVFLESSPVPLVRVAVKNGNVYLNGVPAVTADGEKIKRACRRVTGSSIPATTPDSF